MAQPVIFLILLPQSGFLLAIKRVFQHQALHVSLTIYQNRKKEILLVLAHSVHTVSLYPKSSLLLFVFSAHFLFFPIII